MLLAFEVTPHVVDKFTEAVITESLEVTLLANKLLMSDELLVGIVSWLVEDTTPRSGWVLVKTC